MSTKSRSQIAVVTPDITDALADLDRLVEECDGGLSADVEWVTFETIQGLARAPIGLVFDRLEDLPDAVAEELIACIITSGRWQ